MMTTEPVKEKKKIVLIPITLAKFTYKNAVVNRFSVPYLISALF